MPDEPRQAMHRRLAEVIERAAGGLSDEEVAKRVRGEEDTGQRRAMARVYDLSYHYHAAGDRPRALAYALVAADQARAQFALDVAIQQYSIAERNSEDAPAAVRFRIARGKGEALLQIGRYEEAGRELEAALTTVERSYDIADVRGLQGELASKLGLTAESINHYEEGIRLLGVSVPRTRIGLWWGMFAQSLVMLLCACLPRRWFQTCSDPSADLANQLLARLEWSYYGHNVVNLLWESMVGLNRAERMPPSKSLAVNYVVHANDMAVLGWHSRAEKYYQAAIELSKTLNDHWGAALGLSHFALGCLGAGRYEEAIRKAEPGKTEFVKLGDLFELHASYMFSAQAHYGLGNLAKAFDDTRWLFDSCVRHGDNYLGTWTVYFLSRCTRGQLPIDELLACVRVLPGNNLAASTGLMAEGYCHARRGRTAEALTAFEQAWSVCWSNTYVVTFNSNVLNELVTALRVHTEPAREERPRVRQKRSAADGIDDWPTGRFDCPGSSRRNSPVPCASCA